MHTSGTEGQPSRLRKTWRELEAGAWATARRFGLGSGPRHSIVATVPPQHMFGLETTVVLPLVVGARVHPGRPLFPPEVREALQSQPAPRILVTTPFHLRVLVDSGLDWPKCDFVITATALLGKDLASRAEAAFGVPVREIYGSTETGAVASRRVTEAQEWLWYDQLQLTPRDGGYLLSGGHLPQPVALNDSIMPLAGRRFRLLGRRGDMIKVAGKRASLSDLTQRLLAIPGVEDAAMLAPTETGAATHRLAALVVAPALDQAQLLAAMREVMDTAFLPRPLRFVECLPRNATGKLRMQDLQEMLT